MKRVKLFEQYIAEAKGFKNTKNFIDFLEEIDGMPEFAIKKIMGKEYIDTPGGWSDEKDDYDDIEDYMISNMGRKEFEKLQDWWESNVAESVVTEGATIIVPKLSDIDHTRIIKWMSNQFDSNTWDIKKSGKGFEITIDKLSKAEQEDLMAYLKSQNYISESKVTEGAYGSANPHAKPAGLSKEETLQVAQKFAEAISKADGTKCTVNTRTLEEDSFDLDCDGEEFDGGSYNIFQNGNVMNMALPNNPVYGKKNDSIDAIVKNIKKMK